LIYAKRIVASKVVTTKTITVGVSSNKKTMKENYLLAKEEI
jgi:hypothetical protein